MEAEKTLPCRSRNFVHALALQCNTKDNVNKSIRILETSKHILNIYKGKKKRNKTRQNVNSHSCETVVVRRHQKRVLLRLFVRR